MHKKLQEIANCIPIIKEMIPGENAISIWNAEGVVEAVFGVAEMGINFDVGYNDLSKDDKLFDVIRTGKQVYNKVPKEVFGRPVEGILIPVFDEREVIGVVVCAHSTEKNEEIISNANNLATMISSTEDAITNFTRGTTELATDVSEVQKFTDLVKGQVEEANKVVMEIEKNAKYSNILALNASIESARAGQAGKGFAVVSDEMRKFSKMSGDAASKINQNLEAIMKSLENIKNNIDHSAEIAKEQADAANELHEKFTDVTLTTEKVTEICKELINS